MAPIFYQAIETSSTKQAIQGRHLLGVLKNIDPSPQKYFIYRKSSIISDKCDNKLPKICTNNFLYIDRLYQKIFF